MKEQNEQKKIDKVIILPGDFDHEKDSMSYGTVILDLEESIEAYNFPFSYASYESVQEGMYGYSGGRRYGNISFNIKRLKNREKFQQQILDKGFSIIEIGDLVLNDNEKDIGGLQKLAERLVDNNQIRIRYNGSRYNGKLDSVKLVYIPELYQVKIAPLIKGYTSENISFKKEDFIFRS